MPLHDWVAFVFGWGFLFMKLPYFKFNAADWLLGEIVFEDLETQGLFINICAIYWQRGCELKTEEIEKRFKTDRLAKLTDRFISVLDGNISIKFLDEQKSDFNRLSNVNSQNGRKGGRPKIPNSTEKKSDRLANEKRNESETKAKKSNIDKIREDKNIKISFEQSEIYDLEKFKLAFPDWDKLKLRHYYDAAVSYSAEGNKYVKWDLAIKNWANKDEAKGMWEKQKDDKPVIW